MRIKKIIKKALKLIAERRVRDLCYIAYSKLLTYIGKHANSSKKVKLFNAGVIITERCSLKCKHCANLIQYFENPQHAGLKQVYRDIDLLMNNVDSITYFYLMGGEVLMVKHLPEIIEYVHTKYKKKYRLFSLFANGTIVPDEQTLIAMRKARVVVGISDYGENSFNIDKLTKALRKYKIPYSINSVSWRAIQQITDGDGQSGENVRLKYELCEVNCNSVLNGKLYHCGFLAFGERLGIFPSDKRNSVDLADKAVAKEDIKLYKTKSQVPPGCRYCSGNSKDAPPVPTAEQMPKL